MCLFFFVFSFHICGTTVCEDPEILLPWQRDVTTFPPYCITLMHGGVTQWTRRRRLK